MSAWSGAARDPGRLAARDACPRGALGGDVGKMAGGTAIAYRALNALKRRKKP